MSRPRSKVEGEMSQVVPAVFTIENGAVAASRDVNSRTIVWPLEMLEDDFVTESLGEALIPQESVEGGERRTGYVAEGYTTLLDSVGINHLCFSAVFPETSFLKRKGIGEVTIGSRTYFSEDQSRKLGASLSGALGGAKIRVAPESLCGLVYKVGHITEDTVMHCLTVMMSGRKTVFSLYKVEIGKGERMFENIFHTDLEVVSDSHVQSLIYEYIRSRVDEYVREKDDIPLEYRKVTQYPRERGSEEFGLRVDTRPAYREISKALGHKEVVSSVKVVKGLSVVNESGEEKFVIEAPVFNTEDIQRSLCSLIEENGERIEEVISSVKSQVESLVGEECRYSVLVRSEFFDNPEIGRMLVQLGRGSCVDAGHIEQGAALMGLEGYRMVDGRMFEVVAEDTSGQRFVSEVEVRKKIEAILSQKGRNELRKIFKDVGEESLEGAEELFANIESVDDMRRAVLKWESLDLEDRRVRRERAERGNALNSLKSTIGDVEREGKSNAEVWRELSEEVSRARKEYEAMKKDGESKKGRIEDVEFDLIARSRRLFSDYERRVRVEREKEEARRREEEEARGVEDEKEDEKDEKEDEKEAVPLDEVPGIKMEL